MITMLIVDDEYYIRKGIREAVDWASIGVSIVAEAADGEEGLALALALKPDIILMDIQMPFMDGLKLMAHLKEAEADAAVIVLSGHDEFAYAQKAIQSGVVDYLLKPIETEHLMQAVTRAYETLQARRSATQHQLLLKKDTAILASRFLRDAALGFVTDADMRAQCADLGIPFDGMAFQLIYLKLDDYDILAARMAPDAFGALRAQLLDQMLSRLHTATGTVHVAEVSPHEWAIVLADWQRGEPDGQALLRSRLKEGMETCGQDTYTISISVSRVCDTLAALSALYQEARGAADKLLPGTHSIAFAGLPSENDLRPEVREALLYIKNHYDADITVQTVADRLYISASYLMHIMKKDLGKTFNTCLTELRMERAKALLRDPANKVYEIAKQVGYHDVKHFNKTFKKHTGMTPRDFVRMHYADLT